MATKTPNNPWEGQWSPPPVPVLALVSGGLDSMVLAHLLHQAHVLAGVYHVNYGLRGADSQADEDLVRDWAAAAGVPCWVDHFPLAPDTPDLQATARDLRYSGAAQAMVQAKCAGMATAHHANDAAETFLINASRGTGLAGLVALAAHREAIYRPLILQSKAELAQWAAHGGWSWREDASNAVPKYVRNKIRLEVIPALAQALPQAEVGLQKTVRLLRKTDAFLREALDRESIGFIETCAWWTPGWLVDPSVVDHPHADLLLFHLLEHRGGWEAEHVRPLRSAQVGAHLARNGWELWVERDGWLLFPETARPTSPADPRKVDPLQPAAWESLLWSADRGLCSVRFEATPSPVARQADGSLGTNTEPVLAVLPSQGAWTWRAWEEGDWMNPLGMTGKKKVSDLLTDAKVPSFVRKNVFVLAEAIPGGEVLWIPGMRTAQSVAVNAESSSFWKICAHYL